MIPNFLYHYTSIETLLIILKYQKFRFKRLDLMNDPLEGYLTSFPHYRKFIFSSSWTALSLDEIPMWKMYSNLEGVRLRMPIDLFSHGDSMKISKIRSVRSHNFLLKSTLNKEYELNLKTLKIKKTETPKFKIKSVFGPSQIEYTENVESISKDIILRREDITDFDFFEINLNMIGQKKIHFWAFEKEYRFRIFFGDSIMIAGSDKVLRENSEIVENEYLDIDFVKESLEGSEILLGPKSNNDDLILIENAFKEIGIRNFNVLKSKIEIK
jgi:hypothetical protein